MESVDVLAEFYKHCLNVGGNTRPNGHTTPLWCGWMRCNITPYLVDGKVYNEIHPHFKEVKGEEACKFKNLLLYTLQDYIDYISCFSYKDDDTIQTTKDLLSMLDKLGEDDIVSMIESNRDKFPSQDDCDNDDVLDEKYNTKLNLEIQERNEEEKY
jgi:hypothetical protein